MSARTKIYLNMCWTNASHHSMDTKWVSTCVAQNPPKIETKQNVSQYVLTKIICLRGHIIYLNLCWPNPSHISEDTKCISICTKLLPSQRGHKMYLKMCWPNASCACADTSCIPTCVEETQPMRAETQNATQSVLAKPSHSSEDTKCISIWVDQIHHLPARPQIASQHVLSKPILCQRGHRMCLTCVDKTLLMPARRQNIPLLLLKKKTPPLQRGH